MQRNLSTREKYKNRLHQYYAALAEIRKDFLVEDLDSKSTSLTIANSKSPHYQLAKLGQFSTIASILTDEFDFDYYFEYENEELALIVRGSIEGLQPLVDIDKLVRWLAHFSPTNQYWIAYYAERFLGRSNDQMKLITKESIPVSLFAKQEHINIDQSMDWFKNKEVAVLLFVLIKQMHFPKYLVFIMAEYLLSFSYTQSPESFIKIEKNRPEIRLFSTSGHRVVELFGLDALYWINKEGFEIQKNADDDLYSLYQNNTLINNSFSLPDIAYHIAGQPDSIEFLRYLCNHFSSHRANAELVRAFRKIHGANAELVRAFRKIHDEVIDLIYPASMSPLEKQIVAKSLINVMMVVQNPLDVDAVLNLHKNAIEAPGSSNVLKHFLGAVTMLLGIAVIGLSIAGIPFTGGASVLVACWGGMPLLASSIGFFAHGRQKGLSEQLSNLADEMMPPLPMQNGRGG